MYFGRPSEEAKKLIERSCLEQDANKLSNKARRTREQNGFWQTTIIRVEGVSCTHCKMSVEKALAEVPGVVEARVDLMRKEAVIKGPVARDALVKAVEDAGFSVI